VQIPNVQIEGIGNQKHVPTTFGHPLKKEDLFSGTTLISKSSTGDAVAIQVDKKATFSDGSLWHLTISSLLRNSEDTKLKLFV